MNTIKFQFFILFSAFGFVSGFSQNKDSLQIRRIYDYYLTNSQCYSNLEQLCKTIGGRLSGSPQAAQAVEWVKKLCMQRGLIRLFCSLAW